jgi:regulator of protease activity HflC (stomatin/prohibitin superfamily)
MIFAIVAAVIALLFISLSVKIVPNKDVYIVERLGQYSRKLEAGLHFIIPFIERIAYKQTFKEQAIAVDSQEAITKDNITVSVGGNVYLTVLDPVKASYNVEDWEFAVIQLCKTIMRSAIGEKELDETFSSRKELNETIVNEISASSEKWGVQVSKYELDEVTPPRSVSDAMERQMKSEREKRSLILDSEGRRDAAVNDAEGEKKAKILAAEAAKQSQILAAEGEKEEKALHAQGEADAMKTVANAKAESLATIGKALEEKSGNAAMQFELAGDAIAAKKALAKESTVMMLSDKQSDVSETVAQAMAVSTSLSHSA